ncbi:uncharacterized protein LOC122054704 [Zingiber officinale]|uniref:uncharacterized protein LOC122054704 n=1 Tax=Zingiber officinale TaxID=94328 RepID=UPI001C4D4231|nr:uncharacterized protein LOC122054704 [Zingiber officinale]
MDGKETFWYSCYISDLDYHDLSSLQSNLGLDSAYEFRLPSPDEHPSSPPEGFVTVFRDQILGGLGFPLHPFLSELSQYCDIGISQFAPNVFRAVCDIVILCRIYQILLTAQLFHHFYSFRRAEPGVFNVQVKRGYKFFDDLPSSNKGWKSRFFFLKPPVPLAGPSQWRPNLPSNFPSYVHEPACSAASGKLTGVVVRLSVLMLEGLLYSFGLSPISAEIGAPFGKLLFFLCRSSLTEVLFPFNPVVAAVLRSFASQEQPSVAVLQALNEELIQGLSSDPSASTGLQPLQPQTSDPTVASTLTASPALSHADSSLLRVFDRPATEPSLTEQVPSLPPTMKLRLARKGKRVAPATATSPPPSRRQRVVGISSPSRPSDTSLAQGKASELKIADLSLDVTAPVPIQSLLPTQPSSSGD